MLKVEQISGGYGHVPIVQNVSFEVEQGKVLGILGPNGSGKSTLLKLISSIIEPTAGNVYIEGKLMKSYSAKALAKQMAVLPQLHANAFSNSVYDAVSLGRYPHQKGFFSSWSKEDEEAVENAMAQTGVQKYRDTMMEFLSGGEQQRVFIAQALAQCSNVLLLDEPTNHLDIAHQKQILDMIRKEATECGLTVVSVFHDINLASLYCDELLLMENGQVRAYGAPHEVVLQEQIADVYQAKVSTYAHPEMPKPQITMMPDPISQHKPVVSLEQLTITHDYVQLQTEFPLKVISSAVHNAGMGWYNTFLNRSVSPYYNINDVKEETNQFLKEQGFSLTNTVVMLTAVEANLAVTRVFSNDRFSVIVAVTAGVGNAVDATRTYEQEYKPYIGTINTWVIVNGKLSDEAFYQAMITATEAKTKALAEEDIRDAQTNTVATGTSTDSLLIAATQHGEEMPYAGPITDVGKLIGRGVFETTVAAIQRYKQSKI
ncbi:adenosylcobinamide amidohydrolase [Lysinibacillus sp. KU-BSD001]|uniref:adenosylcobinamide amidohydrolase n=1 Tax=Lysinibacillus sp. KU-BSD001 TaxID=3141328 RepID=UPI0036E14DF3